MPRTESKPNGATAPALEYQSTDSDEEAHVPAHVKGFVRMFVLSTGGAVIVAAAAVCWILINFGQSAKEKNTADAIENVKKQHEDFEKANDQFHSAQSVQFEFFKQTVTDMSARQIHEADDVEQLKDTIGAHMQFTGDKKAAAHLKKEHRNAP